MKSRNLVAGMLVLFVMSLMGAAVAEPIQTPRKLEKSNITFRLNQTKWQQNLKRNKGNLGKLRQQKNVQLIRREKGIGGLLQRDTNNRQFRSRLQNRALSGRLRDNNQVMFSNRLLVPKLQQDRGRRLQTKNVRTRLAQKNWVNRATLSFKRSNPTRRAPQRNTVAAVGSIASVRTAFHKYLANNSIGALLIEKDPASGKTYRLQYAGAPVTKQLGKDKVAFRCNFYGQTSVDSPSVPVSVEYQLTGSNNNWKVSDVRFVSVNGERRSGTFAFSEEELFDADTAAVDLEVEAKEFPVKSL